MARRHDIYANNPEYMKVALCQILTEQWDLQGNLDRMFAALEEASKAGADLAITPECVLNGYGFIEDYKNIRGKMADYVQNIHGEIMERIIGKVRELGINAVVGFPETDDSRHFYNSAALITKDGAVPYVYRKVHCRPFESAEQDGCFTPGEEFHSSELMISGFPVHVGTMICFDREIPESARCLRALGAEFIACPLATKTTDLYDPSIADNEFITRCRAIENEVFIAVVNHAGRFNGGSFIVGPGGEIIVQLGKEEEVYVADIPIGSVKRDFHSNPYGWMGFGYRRKEVYSRYI